ncbi:MAG: Crp/Fnr family transcriptional regulator [Candidatus Delongbacteria bacterium]|nr:Crp/Fnr family transcriptional regulator [Candidatus Delongbacteria bacterium]MBN2836794.1 Crp/Fnr family transcriptional regulator [Candidatus Delongbacteria bacterium]
MSDYNDHYIALKRNDLFKTCPDSYLDVLKFKVSTKRFKRNEIIFHENEIADCFYIILSGKVRIYKLGPNGQSLSIIILQDNNFFGEIGIFSGVRTNFAEAMKETTLLRIEKKDFLDIMKNPYDSSFLEEILKVISTWIIRANKFMLSYSNKDTRSDVNIALVLNDMAIRNSGMNILQLRKELKNNFTIDADISQKHMSQLAGLSSVRFNKKLKQMEEDSIISIEKINGKVIGYKITDSTRFCEILNMT